MSWTENIWAECAPVFKRIIDHPFNRELMDGTLPRKKFEFYILQDALFLAEMQKAIQKLIERVPESRHAEVFRLLLNETTAGEKVLNEHYCRIFQSAGNVEQAPDTLLFTGHLHILANTKSFAEAVGGLLPCFWLYMEVGSYIFQHAKLEGNAYRDWIEMYASTEFSAGGKAIMQLADEVAKDVTDEIRRAMGQAFFMSSRLEWQFWEAAYNLDDWHF